MRNNEIMAAFMNGRAAGRGPLRSVAVSPGRVALYSYDEPIATLDVDGDSRTLWILNHVSYSATTDRHLGAVRSADSFARAGDYRPGGIDYPAPTATWEASRYRLRSMAGIDPDAPPAVTRRRPERFTRRADGSVVRMGEDA